MELSAFNPWDLVLIGALNPIVIGIAWVMGRKADQWQKILVAAFAASLAGIIGIWLVTYFNLLPASGFGWTGGLFVVQLLMGLLWAGGAYWFVRR